MTAQLAAGLKRSIFPALLAALASAGTALGQVHGGATPNQVYFTIGLGAFVTGMIVLVRGVGEGLNDAQRAAMGKVLTSDVTPVAMTDITKILAPYAQRALKQAGIKVTNEQIQAVAINAEHQILAAITQVVADSAHGANAPDPNVMHPAAAAASRSSPLTQDPAVVARSGADFVHGAVAPPDHTPPEMCPPESPPATDPSAES